jgi:hypothetical protein
MITNAGRRERFDDTANPILAGLLAILIGMHMAREYNGRISWKCTDLDIIQDPSSTYALPLLRREPHLHSKDLPLPTQIYDTTNVTFCSA